MTQPPTFDLAALAEPFAPERVSWRVGSTNAKNAGNDPAKLRGQALAYIDARDVQDRLDAVCGPSNWQNRFPLSDGKRVICEIGIRIDGEWVWKSDGAGDTDYEGEKGAISDAFKRAAVKWGVGRYLYDVDAPWVSIEAFGKSFKIVDSEKRRLLNMLPRPAGQAKTQPAANRQETKSEPAKPPAEPIVLFLAEGEVQEFPRTMKGAEAYFVALDELVRRDRFFWKQNGPTAEELAAKLAEKAPGIAALLAEIKRTAGADRKAA